MATDTWLAISAGATFLLALAAFWAIWQNYSFRKKDRELNIKLETLDEIRNWANELYYLIFLASTCDESEQWQLVSRFTPVIRDGVTILQAACIFKGLLEEKADAVGSLVEQFHTALVSKPVVKGKPFIRLDTKKGKDFVGTSLNTIYELLEEVTKTRIELFLSRKN